MARQEADKGAKAKPFLQPGITRAVLIPEQGKGGNLVKVIATSIEALIAANAHLSPEEQDKHVIVLIAFPEPLAGEELASLILAEPPQNQEDASVRQA